MRNVRSLLKQGERIARAHSPEILAGTACAGVVATGYLGWQAGKAFYSTCIIYPEETSRKDRIISDIKHHWKQHIPVVFTAAVTIGCIVMGTRIGMRRTAAMAAAYSISERAFSEYKEKVAEKLGETKERAIRDEIAQDKVTENPPGSSVILLSGGHTLFYEYYTGRYFVSDMETIKRAENEINSRCFRCDYATLAEFHTLIGQPPTQGAMDVGWARKDKLMEVDIHATLTEDNSKAAIVIQYNYLDAL